MVYKHPEAFTAEGGADTVAPAAHNTCQHNRTLIAAAVACENICAACWGAVHVATKALDVPGSEAGLN